MAYPASDRPLRRSFEPLRRCLLERPLLAVSALTLLVSLVFLVAPGLDLAVSGFFYHRLAGFGDQRFASLDFVRELGAKAERVLFVAFIAPLFVKLLAPESRLLVRPRSTLFGVATLALGPGLLVNAILKDHWGRPRPHELLQFGGDAVFSPVWWISDQCQLNCSFVSGEAASAFWLVTLAFLAPAAWRPAVAIATFGFAAAVSFTRIALGGHFLSDVVLAWLLTLLVMIAMQRLILRDLPPEFDRSVESMIGRAGLTLRRWWTTARDGPPAV